jgi:hypothetical protein
MPSKAPGETRQRKAIDDCDGGIRQAVERRLATLARERISRREAAGQLRNVDLAA